MKCLALADDWLNMGTFPLPDPVETLALDFGGPNITLRSFHALSLRCDDG